MATSEVKKLDTKKSDEYYHVRMRSPDQFETIRTPGWTARVAQDVSEGAKVRMGETDAGNWLVQSVLIKKSVPSKRYAMNTARQITKTVERKSGGR